MGLWAQSCPWDWAPAGWAGNEPELEEKKGPRRRQCRFPMSWFPSVAGSSPRSILPAPKDARATSLVLGGSRWLFQVCQRQARCEQHRK